MKDKKCWAPYDIIMIIAYFFICFPILLSYGCPLYQCVIYFLIANILCGILALHWIRRVKDHMRRKHLLSLPIVQDEGRLFYAMPNRIATIPMAVNDGFSYNYGNGNMYEHYHYDRVGVYDGEYASFIDAMVNPFLALLLVVLFIPCSTVCFPGYKAPNLLLKSA